MRKCNSHLKENERHFFFSEAKYVTISWEHRFFFRSPQILCFIMEATSRTKRVINQDTFTCVGGDTRKVGPLIKASEVVWWYS